MFRPEPLLEETTRTRWIFLAAGTALATGALLTPHTLVWQLDLSTALFVGGWLGLAALLGYWIGRREDQLRALCATDPLTGLFNRRHFERCLQLELARTSRHGPPLTLMLLDLDALKPINDQLGHDAGDAAIRSVAAALKASCRAGDLAARWGGDEFVILAPHTDASQAEALAQRLASSVRLHSTSDHSAARARGKTIAPMVTVSVGFGIAQCGQPATLQPATLFANADRALYRAKSSAHAVRRLETPRRLPLLGREPVAAERRS